MNIKYYTALAASLVLMTSFAQFKETKQHNFQTSAAIASNKAMATITAFEAEPTEVLDLGLYRSSGLLNGFNYNLYVYVAKDTITKTLKIKGEEDVFKAAANYEYDGSVLKYSNIVGDKSLFIAQGEPYIKRSNVKFATIGECSEEAESYLADRKPKDIMCQNGVEISEFNKLKLESPVKPLRLSKSGDSESSKVDAT